MTTKKLTIEELLAVAWKQGALAGLRDNYSEPIPPNPYIGVTRVQHSLIITFEGDGGEIFTEELALGREIIFPSDALTVVKIELRESVNGGSEQ